MSRTPLFSDLFLSITELILSFWDETILVMISPHIDKNAHTEVDSKTADNGQYPQNLVESKLEWVCYWSLNQEVKVLSIFLNIHSADYQSCYPLDVFFKASRTWKWW